MHNQAANSSLNNQTEALNNGKELALFDLDHTLLDVDSDYLWGEYIAVSYTHLRAHET